MPDLAPDGPSYLDVNPFALTRQRRAEIAQARKAAFEARYGATIRARMTQRDVERYAAWEARGKPPSPAGGGVHANRNRRRILRARVRREALAELQGGRCYLCGEPFRETDPATEDHVTPRARGGRNDGNLLAAHKSCNARKGDRKPYPCELVYLRAINFAKANGPPQPRRRASSTPPSTTASTRRPPFWRRLLSLIWSPR